RVLAGGPPSAGRVDIGDLLASQIHHGIGSQLKLNHRTFTIACIYHSGITYEDQGAITTLADAQKLAGRTPDETTTVAVRVKPTVTPATAEKAITKAFPGLTA